MTALISLVFQPSESLLKHPPTKDGTSSTLQYPLQNPHYSNYSRVQNTFSLILKNPLHSQSLVFDVHTNWISTTIKVHIILETGEILKIVSRSERNQFIKQFISHNSEYQPKIDPLTGSVYFKFNFFSRSTRYIFNRDKKALVEMVDHEKLWDAVHNLVHCIFTKHEHADHFHTFTSATERGPLSSLTKIVSLLAQTSNPSELFQKREISSTTSLPQQFSNDSNTLPSQFTHFIKFRKEHFHTKSQSHLKKSAIELLSHYNFLIESIKKKYNQKSNLETLILTKSESAKLNDELMLMIENKFINRSLRINNQAEYGKITLKLEKFDEKQYRYRIQLLTSLQKNTEYHFLDKYFRPPVNNIPILISLSLLDQPLNKFFQTNKTSMTFETKLRILLQVTTGVEVLWQEGSIVYFPHDLRKIYVTKNLSVKLRGLGHYWKPEKHILLEDKRLVNWNITQSLLNLTQLYSRLFFNRLPIYIKPSQTHQYEFSLMSYLQGSMLAEKLSLLPYLPQSFNRNHSIVNEYYSNLGYVFLNFLAIAQKQINEQIESTKSMQIFDCQMKQKEFQMPEHSTVLSLKSTTCWLLKLLEFIAIK